MSLIPFTHTEYIVDTCNNVRLTLKISDFMFIEVFSDYIEENKAQDVFLYPEKKGWPMVRMDLWSGCGLPEHRIPEILASLYYYVFGLFTPIHLTEDGGVIEPLEYNEETIKAIKDWCLNYPVLSSREFTLTYTEVMDFGRKLSSIDSDEKEMKDAFRDEIVRLLYKFRDEDDESWQKAFESASGIKSVFSISKNRDKLARLESFVRELIDLITYPVADECAALCKSDEFVISTLEAILNHPENNV